MEALRERKRKLDAELKDTRGKVKVAKKQAAKEALQWSLRGHEHSVAMCIHLMTDCSLEPTTLCVARAAGKHKWPETSDEEMHAFIMETFASAPLDLLLALADEDSAETLPARSDARKHVLE